MNLLILAETKLALWQEIVVGVFKAPVPIAAVGIVAALQKPIRNFLLYQRTQYDFIYAGDQGQTQWDIQWEGYRLTIKIREVHNNFIEDVTVIENDTPPGKTFPTLNATDKFESLFDGKLQFKLNTVIRAIPAKGSKTYILRFVLRHRN